MAERSVVVRIRAEIGDFRKQMQEATKATEQVGKASQDTATKSTTALGSMVQSARKHSQAWDTAGTSLLKFGAAVGVGVGLAIKSYAEFDKAMSAVKAATHASAGDMNQLREAAIKAGADTAFSAKEAAQGIEELAKAGVSVKDILNGGLNGALSLAAAGQMEVKDAAELSATALSTFGLKGDKMSHVADLLAAGAGKAQGSVHDMGEALKQSALVADATGVSIEETTGGLAAFANAGLIGSDAGTSFKTMLGALTPNSKAAAEKMAELGISAYDAQGNFIGLSAFAGNLQTAMQDLTPKARSAAMEIIFGSDAVRAANVLYEQGADGIADWTNKVNEAGYAAITAGIQQDNLAGDFEKLTGSLDSVFLKSGSGANDVLRGLAQSAEDVVDAIGNIPGPVLSTATSVAGLVAGFALLSGGFLTLAPRILDGISAFKQLDTRADGSSRGLNKVAKAAGLASVALVGLQAAGQVLNGLAGPARSFEEMANKILEANKAGEKFGETFDAGFLKQVNAMGEVNVNNLTDLFKASDQDDFFGFMNNAAKALTGYESQVHKATGALGKADEVIASMVKNGNPQAAADTFKQFAKSSEEAGLSTEKLFDRFPEYRDSLLEQARVLGQNVTEAELYDWAMGNVPPKVEAATTAQQNNAVAAQAQAEASQAAAEKLAELGLNADGTIASLEKYTTALFNAGLIQMDVRTATAAHEAAIDAVKGSVEEATAALAKQYEMEGESAEAARAHAEAQMGLGVALNKNKSDFDLTNAAGRALNDSFQAVASTGMAEIEAKAKAGMGQPELQKNLVTTFNNLKQTAIDMGISAGAADGLARKVMGIPPKANINTWMSDAAKRMAEDTKNALDNIPKVTNIQVNTTRTETTFQKVLREISTQPAVGEGTVLAPVKKGGKATGGAISGPGTGTSDDIPAWLSNGEHVLTAAEVAKMGGQAAVYRFRDALRAGDVPKFATGGAVTWGQVSPARWKQLIAQGWHGKAGDKAERLYPPSAEQRKALAELQEFRRDTLVDMDKDNRRGNGYRSVTESLSSSYSFADKLTSLADSGKVGKGSIRNLNAVSGRSEAALRTLHARSDALGKSLDTAKDKLADLTQIRGNVANALSGEFSIGKTAQRQGLFGAGAVANTIADAKGFLAKVKGFAAKLQKLRLKGFSGAIIEEIAGMGTTAGTQAADSLLQATSAQVKDLNNTMGGINAASMSAGNAVTDSLYRGGVNGAAANVKSLEKQEGAISKAMLQIGLGMENALRQALGAKPIKRAGGGAVYGPGTSTSDEVAALLSNGEHVFTADEVRRMGGQRAVYAFRAQLQHLPAPSKSMAGGYGQVQSIPANAMAWGHGVAQAQPAAITNNWKIYDQSNPVATAHEVGRRQRMLGT
ncbi:tape measure protein [Arthrobacter phage EvePickles]|nr:tape measure protein [Arthrobacter phage EvePickles]